MTCVVPAQAGTQRRLIVGSANPVTQRRPIVGPANAVIERRQHRAKAGSRRCVSVLLALTLAACGGRGPYWPIIPPELPPPRVVSDSADGTTVDVVRTQIVQVHLPMEASSPNRWSYELGKDRALYPAAETPRLEGPADQVFTFRAEGTGTTSVRFTYRDPAQPQSTPAKSVAFDVVAR